MECYSIKLPEMKTQCEIQAEPMKKVDDRRTKTEQQADRLKCPRCDSTNTKFCYYNNYSLSQPRYFCKACRRYWTHGGSLRNIPIGGGCRKNKRSSSSASKKFINMHAQTHFGLSSLLEISNDNPSNTGAAAGVPTFFDLLMGGFLESSNNNYVAGVPDWYPPVQEQQQHHQVATFGELLGSGGPMLAAPPATDEEIWRNVTMGTQCLDQDGSAPLMGSLDLLGRDCCVGSTLHSLFG